MKKAWMKPAVEELNVSATAYGDGSARIVDGEYTMNSKEPYKPDFYGPSGMHLELEDKSQIKNFK